MTTEPVAPLKWSSQFSILPASRTPALRGDKIILPPKALEELLSAATKTVQVEAQGHPEDFDLYNPYSVAAQRRIREGTFERQQNLPHPLTFRLVNPQNGKIVFAGIREFSAEENEVGISPFLRESLGIVQRSSEDTTLADGAAESARNQDEEKLTVHVQELSKVGLFGSIATLFNILSYNSRDTSCNVTLSRERNADPKCLYRAHT